MFDHIATSATSVLYEESDPFRFYLACDETHVPDWQAAQKVLKPRPGVVIVEMLRAPTRIGLIYLPSVALETRVDDEAVPGFESSLGIVLAVGDLPDAPLEVRPGDRVLCVDGDGVELEHLTVGDYRAQGKVRIYGVVQPEEDDYFTMPFKGYLEELPWHESIVGKMAPGDKPEEMTPYETNVLVRKDPFKSLSAGGLCIPDVGQERAPTATVVAVGKDCVDTKVGQRVIFHPEGEMDYQDADPDLRMIRELAILTVIEDGPEE